MQQHLERALAGLDVPERELVARLFHQLVTPSGTKIAHAVGDLSRYAGEPPERLEDVLHTLSTERVVRALPGRNGGGARYEIYHDVLAGAVLDWGARHEAERALVAEREAARRRHRRLAIIVGLAFVGLALMGALDRVRVHAAERGSREGRAREGGSARRPRKVQQDLAEKTEQTSRRRSGSPGDPRRKPSRSATGRMRLLAAEERQRAIAEEETDRANADDRQRQRRKPIVRTARQPALTRSGTTADLATAKAVRSKNEEVVQRKKAERAFVNEQSATRKANAARDEAQASELVSRAITLLGTDPEQSVQLALDSADLARTPRLEIALRDALSAVRTRAVLPGGGGAVSAVSTTSPGQARGLGQGAGVGSRAGEDASLVLVTAEGGEARVYESTGKLLSPTASRLAAERRRLLARRRIGGDGREGWRRTALERPHRRAARTIRPRRGDPPDRLLAGRPPVRHRRRRSGPRLARRRRIFGRPTTAPVPGRRRLVQPGRDPADDDRARRKAVPYERLAAGAVGARPARQHSHGELRSRRSPRSHGRPRRLGDGLGQPRRIETASDHRSRRRRDRAGVVAERRPVRDRQLRQRRPRLPCRHRRPLDLPRSPHEPGRRDHLQPRRRHDRHGINRWLGPHLDRRPDLRAAQVPPGPLAAGAGRRLHLGRTECRDGER